MSRIRGALLARPIQARLDHHHTSVLFKRIGIAAGAMTSLSRYFTGCCLHLSRAKGVVGIDDRYITPPDSHAWGLVSTGNTRMDIWRSRSFRNRLRGGCDATDLAYLACSTALIEVGMTRQADGDSFLVHSLPPSRPEGILIPRRGQAKWCRASNVVVQACELCLLVEGPCLCNLFGQATNDLSREIGW